MPKNRKACVYGFVGRGASYMYEKEYTVRFSEVAPNAHASLSAMVSYFQDTTMEHSNAAGQGVCELMEKGLAWLLASWHIKIIRYPKYNEKIYARTWATRFAGVYGYRDFEIVDTNGERIAAASSAWILYNANEQKMLRVSQKIADVYAPEGNFVFGENEARIRAPKQYTDVGEYTVRRRDLDTNRHVNNIHYIDFALDALDEKEEIKELRISYKKAAVLGDKINIGLAVEDGADTCVLHDDDGSVYAVLRFEK